MAIANFKYGIFDTARALHEFVTSGDVVSVVSIVTDGSGKFIVFYLSL